MTKQNKATQTTKTESPEDLVDFTTAKGSTYHFPRKYHPVVSVSAVIRALTADGWSKWQIHKVTDLRYQHVRNVLTAPTKK